MEAAREIFFLVPIHGLFVWLVADGGCWFVLRKKYYWLIVGGWFVLREKYYWLVADKPNEQVVEMKLGGPAKRVRQVGRCWVGDKQFIFCINALQIVIFMVVLPFLLTCNLTGGSDVRGKADPNW
jgi:hypothetical protein